MVNSKREEIFLDKAIKYKKDYQDCSWWKFRKKRKLYDKWQKSLSIMMLQ